MNRDAEQGKKSVLSDNSTSKARVLAALRGGKWISPLEISKYAHCQHNTALKDIKFLRDEGYQIDKRRVEVKGGNDYYVYKLVQTVEIDDDDSKLIKQIEARLREYPESHADAIKGREQIDQLRARKRRAA